MIKCDKCNFENDGKSKYCHACGYALPASELVAAQENSNAIKATKESSKTANKSAAIKTKIGWAIGCIVFFVIAYFVGSKLANYFGNTDNQLAIMAKAINVAAPVKVDEITRLDGASILEDGTFQYSYTLISLEKEAMDIPNFESSMRQTLTNAVQTNEDMAYFMEHDITLEYRYLDKNNTLITRIVIIPSEL